MESRRLTGQPHLQLPACFHLGSGMESTEVDLCTWLLLASFSFTNARSTSLTAPFTMIGISFS